MKPDKRFYPRPLWFWNDKPTKEGIQELMQNAVKLDKWAGFGILPFDACKLEYMSDEYLYLYRVAAQQAKELGIKLCLYDEWWFPSGWAGGILKKTHPESLAKRLDLEKFELTLGQNTIQKPNGKVMAVVLMKNSEILDAAPFFDGEKLNYNALEDGWHLLFFMLRESGWDHVDYLDPRAVQSFIEITHDKYYEELKEYFGSVIDSVFYDEPQFYGAGGRAWTEGINKRFIEDFGEDPAIYYPALFYDIGDNTCFARNSLLSTRAKLYAEGFPRTVQKWCDSHGVFLTGHVDQEEVENPVGMTGDLMLSFKYQDVPGIDEIAFVGRGSKAYKVVSSAAVNWDKSYVMTECFGAMDHLTEDDMKRELYDLFSKGINFIVPHALWYNNEPDKVIFKPELSYRDEYYGRILPSISDLSARLSEALQAGGQVNELAILYPIESLNYMYTLNWGGDPYLGGPTYDENDYMRLGEQIKTELGFDFTFLHPLAIKESGFIEDGKLKLKSDKHFQEYSTVIMPGMKAISLYTLNMLREFVAQGGILISVTELPYLSSDKNGSREVRSIISEMFGCKVTPKKTVKKSYGLGKCISISQGNYNDLQEILRDRFDTKILSNAKGLQWIRKRNDEGDVWMLCALQNDIDTKICIKGKWQLYTTDLSIGKAEFIDSYTESGNTVFSLRLKNADAILIDVKRTD